MMPASFHYLTIKYNFLILAICYNDSISNRKESRMDLLEDPYMILYMAPIIFGIIYVVVSFFGERGD